MESADSIPLDTFLRGRKGLAAAKALSRGGVFTPGRAFVRQEKGVVEEVGSEIVAVLEARGFTVSELPPPDQIRGSPAVSLAVGWDQMLEVRAGRLIVLHDSLLPSLRGWSPLVNALKEGRRLTGVTAFLANDYGFDQGRILRQTRVFLEKDMYLTDALRKVESAVFRMVRKVVSSPSLLANRHGRPQFGAVTTSPWLDHDDFRIDWTESSHSIVRKIRASSEPYVGCSSLFAGEVVRIRRARHCEPPLRLSSVAPGKLLDVRGKWAVVGTGTTPIEISEVFFETSGEETEINKLRVRFR